MQDPTHKNLLEGDEKGFDALHRPRYNKINSCKGARFNLCCAQEGANWELGCYCRLNLDGIIGLILCEDLNFRLCLVT